MLSKASSSALLATPFSNFSYWLTGETVDTISGYEAVFSPLTTTDPRTSTGSCLSVLNSSVTALQCAGCTNRSPNNVTVNATDTDGSPITAVETTLMVRWQAADEAIFAKATSPSRGLSGGQKATIGVGIAVGVLLVAGVLGMFILVRRNRAASRPFPRQDIVDNTELHGDGNGIELLGQSENRPRVQIPPPTYGNTDPKHPSTSSPRQVISPLSPAEPPPYSPQERGDTPAVYQETRSTEVNSLVRPPPEAGERLGSSSSNEAFRLREEDRLLNERRASLRETLRLLDEDERLRTEQEAVRRRLAELEKERG